MASRIIAKKKANNNGGGRNSKMQEWAAKESIRRGKCRKALAGAGKQEDEMEVARRIREALN